MVHWLCPDRRPNPRRLMAKPRVCNFVRLIYLRNQCGFEFCWNGVELGGGYQKNV